MSTDAGEDEEKLDGKALMYEISLTWKKLKEETNSKVSDAYAEED